MSNKIIIGTANFGSFYGIRKKKIPKSKIITLCKFARKKNIKYLDTSTEYFKSNKIIKDLNKKLLINTKILPNKNWVKPNFCLKQLIKIKKDLGNKKLDTVYLHDEKIIFKKYFIQIYYNLLHLKQKKHFKKLGISIYDFKTINFFLKKFKFDAVQCPFNIFDQRLISQNYYQILKSRKIEIHARSIFLQGLLLNKQIFKFNNPIKLKKKINFLHEFGKLNNIKVIDLCMTFVTKHKINKFVIGFDDLKNLKDVLNFKKIYKINFKKFSIVDKKLFDPRYWKNEKL